MVSCPSVLCETIMILILDRRLNALWKVVNYMARRAEKMNVDAIFGLTLAEGKIFVHFHLFLNLVCMNILNLKFKLMIFFSAHHGHVISFKCTFYTIGSSKFFRKYRKNLRGRPKIHENEYSTWKQGASYK